MPIFEFRCLNCGKVFEKLFRESEDSIEIKCPDCGSEEAQRVVSKTNHAMGTGKAGKKPKLTTKSCGEGNTCATLELPGLGD